MSNLDRHASLQQRAMIFNALGLACLMTSRVLRAVYAPALGSPLHSIVLFLALLSFGCWIRGLSALAQSKGYSKWLGVLGLLSFIGWIIVSALPDRWHEPIAEAKGDYPRPSL